MIKILIADDQELIRQSLQIILDSEKDFEVTDTAANGVEVIRSIRKERPDVILMDIRMPEMDGVVCTQIIKENYPDIKIIILTPETSEINIINTLFAHADGYFIRDFKQDNLQKIIFYTLSGHGGIDKRMQFSLFNYINKLPNKVYSEFTGTLTSNESTYITLTINGFSKSEIATYFDMPVANLYRFIYSILEKLQSKIGLENLYQEMKYDLC